MISNQPLKTRIVMSIGMASLVIGFAARRILMSTVVSPDLTDTIFGFLVGLSIGANLLALVLGRGGRCRSSQTQ